MRQVRQTSENWPIYVLFRVQNQGSQGGLSQGVADQTADDDGPGGNGFKAPLSWVRLPPYFPARGRNIAPVARIRGSGGPFWAIRDGRGLGNGIGGAAGSTLRQS